VLLELWHLIPLDDEVNHRDEELDGFLCSEVILLRHLLKQYGCVYQELLEHNLVELLVHALDLIVVVQGFEDALTMTLDVCVLDGLQGVPHIRTIIGHLKDVL
jgi:hypothetical protein